jgi:hypothetical protein
MLSKMGTVLAIGYRNVRGVSDISRRLFGVLSDFLDIVLSVYRLIYMVLSFGSFSLTYWETIGGFFQHCYHMEGSFVGSFNMGQLT